VLRKGEYVGTVNTDETSESELTEMMVGKKIVLNIERTEPLGLDERLFVKDLSCVDIYGVQTLKSVDFSVKGGEILGIAGIAGSGQRELFEAIAGLQPTVSGEITYVDPETQEKIDLRTKSAAEIRDMGIRLSFVPEDRLGMGLVGNMDAVDNMMLRGYEKSTLFVDRKTPKKLADKIIEELEVVTPGVTTPVRRLSGGNVQKLLVGREIASAPKVFMAAYPVRGLDINSSYTIYNLLNSQKKSGAAVLFVGEDLDVLLALCDRIMVIASGKITGIVDARSTTKEEVGLLMTKTTAVNEENKQEDGNEGSKE
jgi:simple sugar transport system ATP-binding protein